MFFRHKASLLVEQIGGLEDRSRLERSARRLGLKGEPSRKMMCEKILSVNYLEKDVLDEIGLELGVDFDAYLASRRPYLTDEDVREIVRRGFYVGAHSVDHPEYALLSVDQQVDQTVKCMDTIADRYGLPYRIFAAPFHDVGLSRKYFEAILNGHIDVSFGIEGTLSEPVSRNFQRFNMEGERKFPAGRMLTAYFLVMFVLRFFHKQQIRRE